MVRARRRVPNYNCKGHNYIKPHVYRYVYVCIYNYTQIPNEYTSKRSNVRCCEIDLFLVHYTEKAKVSLNISLMLILIESLDIVMYNNIVNTSTKHI